MGDGVCDCCDGSDEPSGACANSCEADGALRRAAARETAARAREGMLLRGDLVLRAADEIARRRAAAEGLGERIASARASADELQRARDTIEQSERAAREQNADAGGGDVEDASPPELDTEVAREPDVALPPPDAVDADEGEDGAGEEGEQELSEEERARRIAARWQGAGNVEDADPEGQDAYGDAYKYDGFGRHEPYNSYEDYGDSGLYDSDGEVEGPDASAALLEARRAASDAEKEVRELEAQERELQELERKLAGGEYGDSAAYLLLGMGECLTTEDAEYTYSVCPFGKATQKTGLSSTQLGEFARWHSPEAGIAPGEHGSALVFEGGFMCPGGPARSTQVTVLCAAEERLTAFREPERCAYAAEWHTPAACTEAAAEAAARALERVERAISAGKRGVGGIRASNEDSGGHDAARDELRRL